MTVGQLVRTLKNMSPHDRIWWVDGGKLAIGKDFLIQIPSALDHEIESIYLERHGAPSAPPVDRRDKP